MTRPGTRQRRTSNRRSGVFPGRRFALELRLAAVTTTTLAALALAPAALADAGAPVIVTATIYSSSGASPDSVSLAALQQDPQCQPYSAQSMQELGRQGWVDVSLPPPGTQTGTWSISTILACLAKPVPIAAVSGVTVMNADGTPQEGAGSPLTPADLATPSDFNSPSEAPVVEDRGSVIQYDRPWRGSPSDEDFLDEVQGSQNGQPAPIAIDVFEGPLLSVTATASATSVPVGTTVDFQSNVSPPGQSGLSYRWTFDGAAPDSSAVAPQVRFTSAGQYNVTVQVTDAGGGGGGASLLLTVGSPAPSIVGQHPQAGGGRSHKSHTPTGPRQSRGQHPESPRGSSHGQGAASPHSGRDGSPTATPGRASPGSAHPAGSGSSRATPTPAARPPSRSRHASRLAPRPGPPPGALAPLVTGRFISDVTPLPPGASPLVRTAAVTPASAPPARQPVQASALPVLAGSFATALLFLLGAGRELGWTLPKRPPWIGRASA